MISSPKAKTKPDKHALPNGWRWVRIGDVCQTTSGGTPQRGNIDYYNGKIPWVKSGELNDKFIYSTKETITELGLQDSSAKLFPTGTLLIALYGATMGKLGILGIAAATNQAVCAIFTSEEINRDFLFYALLGKRNELIEASFGGAQPNISQEIIRSVEIPLPPLNEQKQMARRLNEELAAVEYARKAAEKQLELLSTLVNSYLRESLETATTKIRAADGLIEIKKGIGETWEQYPVIGATRAGVAPAKEKVGKQPQRYKLVVPGTILYNPMRINIGSIGMIDEGDEAGITSPDYVVFQGREGIIHPRWFYYWLRSPYGEQFIKSLARGAVRERMLFNRLKEGEIEIPSYGVQVKVVEKLKEIRILREAVERQLEEINALPSAILRRVFNP